MDLEWTGRNVVGWNELIEKLKRISFTGRS